MTLERLFVYGGIVFVIGCALFAFGYWIDRIDE